MHALLSRRIGQGIEDRYVDGPNNRRTSPSSRDELIRLDLLDGGSVEDGRAAGRLDDHQRRLALGRNFDRQDDGPLLAPLAGQGRVDGTRYLVVADAIGSVRPGPRR